MRRATWMGIRRSCLVTDISVYQTETKATRLHSRCSQSPPRCLASSATHAILDAASAWCPHNQEQAFLADARTFLNGNQKCPSRNITRLQPATLPRCEAVPMGGCMTVKRLRLSFVTSVHALIWSNRNINGGEWSGSHDRQGKGSAADMCASSQVLIRVGKSCPALEVESSVRTFQ